MKIEIGMEIFIIWFCSGLEPPCNVYLKERGKYEY